MKKAMGNMRIDGTTDTRFESVARLFERQMNSLAEECAQLCVYVGDEMVVDLCASRSDVPGFTADSLVNVFSSGKSLESIALAALVSQGLLDYREKIATYWPAFAANGKAELTVADLMRHEAGLATLGVSIPPGHLLTENIQRNLVGSIIEQQGLRYRDGGAEDRREYHAITRGWIANELFRRVDPRGRTIGQFLRDDLCGPLDADTYIGVPEQVLARIVPISPLGLGFHLKESLKPGFLGRRVKDNIFQTTGKLLPMVSRARRRTTADAPPPFEGMEEIAFFNERSVAMGETPSANTHSSARGLARLAAVMANRGRWQDVQYLDESAWQAMHDEPETRTMGFNVTFTQGGLARFGRSNAPAPAIVRAANDGREGFYGWMGLGGSIFQWHPELGIGFAFVPTSLHVLDIVNERGKLFQAEVLRCVQS